MTERIRLAKRLALVLMIVRKYELFIITRLLNVSNSTVYVMQQKLNFENKAFKKGVEELRQHQRMEIFWRKVNKIIEYNIFKPSIRPPLNL